MPELYPFRYPFGYPFYGLKIATNRPLPDVTPLAAGEWPLVDLCLAFLEDTPIPARYSELPWRLLSQRHWTQRTQEIWTASTPTGSAHRFYMIDDGGYFEAIAIPAEGQEPARIEVYWQRPALSPDVLWQDVAAYSFDVVLSYMARWHIPAVLHGSVLARLPHPQSAFALIGASGAGKSTLTAAFLSAGYAMLSDDHVALWPRQGQFWVEPGLPRIRLWPQSVAVIEGINRTSDINLNNKAAAQELPRVYSFMEKRLKNLQREESGARFHASALPLAALFLLAPREPQRSEVLVERLAHKRVLQELWGGRDTSLTLSPQQSAAEFGLLAQVAQQVPVFYVYRPDSLQSLPQVMAAITATLEGIARGSELQN